MADENIKKEEKAAEKEAEAEPKLEKEASKEENANPDEKTEVAAQVEEAAGVEEETPAEVETINTDNETAKEASAYASPDANLPAGKAGAMEDKKATEDQSKAKNQLAPRSSKGEGGEPTGKFKNLIKDIEGLTTVELAELVKALEERFGVSAAAPVATTGAPAATGVAGAPAEEEKAIYTVVLTDSGSQKIAVIKALREINQELGLKEAKDIADAPPKEILKDAPKEKAEEAKKKLEAAGAKVELK